MNPQQQFSLRLRERSVSLSYATLATTALALAIILIIFGVITRDTSSVTSVVLLSVGSGLFSTVMFSVMDSRTSRREFAGMMTDLSGQVVRIMSDSRSEISRELRSRELAAVADERERLVGLQAIFPSDKDATCQEVMTTIVKESRNLVLVMNYGRDWIAAHSDDIRDRLLDSGKSTSIFMPNLNSTIIDVQSEKQECDPEDFRDKQTRTYREMTILSPMGQEAFDILGHPFFHPFFLVFGDGDAILVPLYLSRGKKETVAMWLKDTGTKDGMYSRLHRDIQNLRESAQDLRPVFEQRLIHNHGRKART